MEAPAKWSLPKPRVSTINLVSWWKLLRNDPYRENDDIAMWWAIAMGAMAIMVSSSKPKTYMFLETINIYEVMQRKSVGMSISGELNWGKWPSVSRISTDVHPPRLHFKYSATWIGTARSFMLWITWHGTPTCNIQNYTTMWLTTIIVIVSSWCQFLEYKPCHTIKSFILNKVIIGCFAYNINNIFLLAVHLTHR